jgi:hypothetical protein
MKMRRLLQWTANAALILALLCLGLTWWWARDMYKAGWDYHAFLVPSGQACRVRVVVRDRQGQALTKVPIVISTSSGTSRGEMGETGELVLTFADHVLLGLQVGRRAVINRRDAWDGVSLVNGVDLYFISKTPHQPASVAR